MNQLPEKPEFKEVSDADFIVNEQPEDELAILIKSACYDCHSDQTKMPWYSNLAPLSWWIIDHVEHGKKHLNFSEWTAYSEDKKAHKAEECVEMLEEGEMPLSSYQIAHSDARISDEQREALIEVFNAIYKKY